ncbi:hypothetical protein HPB50_016721 [Hyalomma asiaticum]|uniref:Uncharacterized protein n=1 Tax=Hyalomma asiaticum TaxID=266040 RepID=A0ACB7SI03_HYAAI|nr:hypothetical protein HPB50_016721 [Hyalomma asiaticum]
MAASGAASPMNTSAVRQVRKPRRHFRIHEDLCLLREVAAANPFENPQMWEEVLRNVVAAIERDVTLRAVKERVELLLNYFRREDTANLRKSGTEEQYGELQQLLQEVSDLAREFNYEPRTRSKKKKMGRHRRGTKPGRQLQNETASSVLLGIFDQDQRVPPEEGSRLTPEPVDNGQADEGTVQGSDDVEAFIPQRQQAQPKRRRTQAAPRGLRALQTLGLELLTKREEYEFELRKQEIELARRRLDHDERRLLLDEAKHRFEVECRREDREQLLERLERLERHTFASP